MAAPESRRKFARAFTALGVIAALFLTGGAINALFGPQALNQMESWTSRFEQAMRFIRPVILILMFSFWQILIALAMKTKVLSQRLATLALEHWLHLALWTAAVELTIGQGQIVFGLFFGTCVYIGSRLNLIPRISIRLEATEK